MEGEEGREREREKRERDIYINTEGKREREIGKSPKYFRKIIYFNIQIL